MILALFFQNPIAALIIFGSIVVALSVHEFAHAYSADKLGDSTPRSQGRVTLNPLSHLDIWGTLLLLIIGIGWGKPVMFNPFHLKNPRRDTAIIAFAGPLSNIVMAFIAAIILVVVTASGTIGIFEDILMIFILLNFALAIFNMIPIEPLDGFKVLAGILPPHLAYQWEETRRYGIIVLVILLVTGALGGFVFPTAQYLSDSLVGFLRSVVV